MKITNPNHPIALIVLTPQEREEFLPEPLRIELNNLLPNAIWVEAPIQADEWSRLLDTHQPEILVCAWETPTLPPAAAAHLKYVCYLCGSVRTLIPRDLIANGLLATNWGSIVSNTVAECTLLLILAALRRSTNWALAMHTQGAWKQGRHPDTLSLFHRRVGIHGLGAIGRDLVKLLGPFNVEISAYSPSVPDETYEQLNVHRAATLEELFSQSDVLVELAPGKPENHHLVGEELLNLLPEKSVFVNVGRGMVVDEEAMIRISQEKGIHLALDVYETEPLPKDSPLRGLPNTTLLPHLGGPTPDRRRDCGELALENLGNYLNHDPLINLVTLEAYDRAT